MTVQWTYAEAIAREMAFGRVIATIVVRSPLHPVDVAGDIHSRLSRRRCHAICVHAEQGLDAVHDLAVDHGECPLVVTAATTDWSPLVNSRAWVSRKAAIAFVLDEDQAQSLHPEVRTLTSIARHIFVSAVGEGDPRSRELLRRARDLMSGLVGERGSYLRRHCADIGLNANRINFNCAGDELVFHYVEDALKSQLLIPAFERLRDDYPRAEVDAILREMRALYFGEATSR